MGTAILLAWSLWGVGAQSVPEADLESVSWIVGDWVAEKDGVWLEETWRDPRGGSMIGMFRWVQEGRVSFYEFLAIEQEGNGLVMKLRHFNRGLVAWEEKDAPLSFRLVKQAEGEAVFDNQDESKRVRLLYRRAGPDALSVVLERSEEGKPSSTEFQFRRR